MSAVGLCWRHFDGAKCLIITEMFIFLTNSLWCAYQRLIKPRGKKLSRSDLQIVNAPERPGILEL